MLRNTLLLLSVILLSFSVKAQSLIETDLPGSWKVLSIVRMELEGEISPKANKKEIETFKNELRRSTFMFNSGQIFSYDINVPELRVKRGRWRYDPAKKAVIVTEWTDKRSVIMTLFPVRKEGKIYFIMDEVGTFEVQKQ